MLVITPATRSAVNILALLGMLPTGRGAVRAAKFSRLGLHTGKPSRSHRIKRWARLAHFHFLLGQWAYQPRLDEPQSRLDRELLALLNQLEHRETVISDKGKAAPQVSQLVLDEIETILEAMESADTTEGENNAENV